MTNFLPKEKSHVISTDLKCKAHQVNYLHQAVCTYSWNYHLEDQFFSLPQPNRLQHDGYCCIICQPSNSYDNYQIP